MLSYFAPVYFVKQENEDAEQTDGTILIHLIFALDAPDIHGCLVREIERVCFVPIELLPKWCYTLAMEQKEAIVATNTRYPRDLHDALQRLARAHRRSFNAEVMWALQQYVHQEGAGIDDAQRMSQIHEASNL